MFRNTKKEVTPAGGAALIACLGGMTSRDHLSSYEHLEDEARQKYYVTTELRDSLTERKRNLPQKDSPTEFHACVHLLWPGEERGEWEKTAGVERGRKED
ncbi:hypothetical protein E2C01_002009 [Portunus trituberculatus]|uniref:Uncharacterized protein n=1 Tax=Portunus trituberculatus TaxID=210409 RepID=A0A5B7CJQ7_PORTR|nr:hypothetical protein [Portunus trituberculatus]